MNCFCSSLKMVVWNVDGIRFAHLRSAVRNSTMLLMVLVSTGWFLGAFRLKLMMRVRIEWFTLCLTFPTERTVSPNLEIRSVLTRLQTLLKLIFSIPVVALVEIMLITSIGLVQPFFSSPKK